MGKTYSNNKTIETKFLISFFEKLKFSDITYCILRNYEFLPYNLNGSDIDMFIAEQDFLDFHRILKVTIAEFGGHVISILSTPNVKDIAVCGTYNNEWWGTRFDTFTYIGTNECSIFSNNYILKRIEFYNNIKVLNKSDAAILGFIKELIGAKKYNQRYSQVAIKSFLLEQEHYYNAFCETLPEIIVTNYLIPFFRGEVFFSEDLCRIIFSGYQRKKKEKGLIRYWMNTINNYKYKFIRLLNTPGFSIVVMGTDGSGKTTIINILKPMLEKPLHNVLVYSHMRPNMIPNIAQLLGKSKAEGPNRNPHDGQVSGAFVSILRLLYYSFDYVVGYWVLVNTTLAKKTTIWFFDRYYYDYLIDQKRASINLPLWVIKFVEIFIPSPDLILCLGADPNVIYLRKPELPLNEIKLHVRKLKEFCSTKHNAIWIDTGKNNIDETINYTMKVIISKMANRYV